MNSSTNGDSTSTSTDRLYFSYPEPRVMERIIPDSWTGFFSKFNLRIRYYVPILKWAPKYNVQQNLLHDVVAGLSVATLMIPQGLSYASGLAKLDPVCGLYSSFLGVFIYGVLGTSRQLSVGPEALVALLIGNAVAASADKHSPDEHLAVAAVLSLIVGVISLTLGICRLGFIDSIMSRSLLRGFITAVACVIMIEQLPQLLGLVLTDAESPRSPLSLFLATVAQGRSTNCATALTSLFSVLFLFSAAKLKQYFLHLLFNESQQMDVDAPRPPQPPSLSFTSMPPSSTKIADLESPPHHPKTPPSLVDDDALSIASQSASSFSSAVDHESNENLPLLDPTASLPRSTHTTQFLSVRNSFLFSHVRADSLAVDKFAFMRAALLVPEILIVSIVTIFFSYVLGVHSKYHVEILGDAALQTGFRMVRAPKLTWALFALTISILGFVESIVVTKNYASKYNYPVSANRELVALGTLNVLGSFFNCFPTFASLARSQVNDSAGARTQLAGVITGLIILLTILLLLPVFFYLPKCVMASIILVAAGALLEFEDIWFMVRIRAWRDLTLMSLAFLVTIVWSVEGGVFVSIGCSLILVLQHSTRPKISILGKVMEEQQHGNHEIDGMEFGSKVKYKPLHEIESSVTVASTSNNSRVALSSANATTSQSTTHLAPSLHSQLQDDEILVVKVEESLFFANTGQMKDRLRRAEVYSGHLHTHPSEEEHRPIDDGRLHFRVQNHNDDQLSPSHPSASSPHHSTLMKAQLHHHVDPHQLRPSTPTSSPHPNHQLHDHHHPLPIQRAKLRAVIFDIENVPSIDASAIQILLEIVESYQLRKIEVCFVKLRESNRTLFLASGLMDQVSDDHFFRKISEAIDFLRLKLQHHSTPSHSIQ